MEYGLGSGSLPGWLRGLPTPVKTDREPECAAKFRFPEIRGPDVIKHIYDDNPTNICPKGFVA